MRTPMRADDTPRGVPRRAAAARDRGVRADRRGQDRGRDRARRALRGDGRGPGRGLGRRAAALRRAGDPHRRGDARRSGRGSSTGWSARCRSPRASAPAHFARRAHAEIDALLAAGRRPIVVGGTGLYLRAALADLDLRPPPDPACASAGGPARRARARALHAELPRARPRPRPASRRPTPSAWSARSSCSTPARARRPRGRPAVDGATPATRRCWSRSTMERAALYARIDARVDAMVAAGAEDEVRARRRGGRLAVRAPGARASRSCSPATSRR